MKIKTSELIGPALDWAVIVANGQDAAYWLEMYLSEGRRVFCARSSTEWVQGGPIIDREGISLLYLYVTDDPFRWAATQKPNIRKVKPDSVYGPTPLIAAMRCYVASKLGDEVDVPEELL